MVKMLRDGANLTRRRSKWSRRNILIGAGTIIAAVVLGRVVCTMEGLREREKEEPKKVDSDGLYAPMSASQTPPGFRQYSSGQDGFSIFFPGDPEVNSYVRIRHHAVVIEGEGAYNVFVNTLPKPVRSERAISSVLKHYMNGRLRVFGEAATSVRSEEVFLSGHKALEYQYAVRADSMTSYYRGVCLVGGTRLYAVTVVCVSDTKDVAFGKHATMVESFRLTKLEEPKMPAALAAFFDAVRANEQAKVQEELQGNPGWVHAKDKYGNTPLHVAVLREHAALAELLIAKGAKVNVMDNITRDTPLHVAARMGNREMAELLIQKGADVHAKNKAGYAPLHRATQSVTNYEQPDIVRLLVAEGADINVKTKWGLTPLHFAARRGHRVVAELLIAGRADVNAKSYAGTPLEAALENRQLEMAELLRQHGAKR